MTESEIRADERRKIAAMIAGFSWILPLHGEKMLNEASDDAACMVQQQIVAAVVALS